VKNDDEETIAVRFIVLFKAFATDMQALYLYHAAIGKKEMILKTR